MIFTSNFYTHTHKKGVNFVSLFIPILKPYHLSINPRFLSNMQSNKLYISITKYGHYTKHLFLTDVTKIKLKVLATLFSFSNFSK